MANPRHAAKEKPLFNTRLPIILILILAAVLAGLIFWFLLRPLDVSTVAGHVAQHVRPTTGKIIAKAPQVKRKALTAAQLHAHHVRHILHLARLHRLHVLHVEHVTHEVVVVHTPRSMAESFGKVITVRLGW